MKIIKKIFNFIFSRVVIISLGILFQLGWWLFFSLYLSTVSHFVSGSLRILSLLIVLWLVNKKINPSYKLAWTILILSAPVFGVTIYFLTGHSKVAKNMEKRFVQVMHRERHLLKESEKTRNKMEALDCHVSNQSKYIRDYAEFPLQENTQCTFYSSGEELYQPFLDALRSAEHFIFLEYFIIGEGKFWNSIKEILLEKARCGVDIRLIYDDWGCITTLPYRFYKELQDGGIQCAAFNPYRPFINIILNNRDHRKICVIDGHTGFTGGINLADEYINEKVRFGYWKDTAICFHGEAVWNLTFMFLQMWTVVTRTETRFEDYMPHRYHPQAFPGEGFVQPYCDTPLDNEVVGENVYMNMINRARKYVYICTPYLIIDNEMTTSLCTAAKSGVDIRIMTPGIPDKKMVFLLTQSYYEQLIEAGVRIYQYSPGFNHAKSFVCDDELAIIGTINMDYRSLYLHFENGVWIYKNSVVDAMKKDYLQDLEKCDEISLEFCKKRNMIVRAFQSLLRLLAPML